jgi:hypothetical protein
MGTSTTTFTSWGGFFPIEIASRRMELFSGTRLGAFSFGSTDPGLSVKMRQKERFGAIFPPWAGKPRSRLAFH